MRQVFPSESRRCIPFDLAAEQGGLGPRLGGRPPLGVVPPGQAGSYVYFATLPLLADPLVHVSVFLPSHPEALFERVGRICEQGPVAIAQHAPAPRIEGDVGSLCSALSERSVSLRGEADDWFLADDGSELTEQAHKLGGRPYLLGYPGVEQELVGLVAEGFGQVAQFGFPAKPGDVPVLGTWPFGDGFFHLFARVPFGPSDWRWLWEF